jgi:hypothetical protein
VAWGQGRRKHQKIGGGGGHRLLGALWVLKRAPKKFFPEILATGGGGLREKISHHTIPKLHVCDQIFLKNLEISKGHIWC